MKIKLLTAAALSLFAPLLASAQNADLTMSGAIVPGACTPAFSGGGVIDLGRHSASTLNAGAATALPDSDAVTLTITCDASTVLLLTYVDNQGETVEPTVNIPGAGGQRGRHFGVGEVGGVKIGAYMLYDNVGRQVDGVRQVFLRSSDPSGGVWVNTNNLVSKYTVAEPFRMTMGLDAATGPTSGLVHVMTYAVRVVVRNGSELPLASEIPLAGSTTIQVAYL